ncbi:toll-like receptor 6 [Leucoraja erinacea]|uniref:toll-like receptor 6 n=1 Tax=Leucoraja erinaceus TaxID=7782 RepID=UPI002454CA81|nr:toll-like receptor 6 [Leucoraja erinacea]XP_055493582.1 toll-like receptor 6 [Leucoraja erinacea]
MSNTTSFIAWISIFKVGCSLCFPAENNIVINNSSSSLIVVPSNLRKQTEILDLSQNNISKIHIQDFASLQWLRSLNLSINRISNVANASFRFNRKLECLDLSRNELSNIECHFLNNITSLKYFDISSNRFLSLTLGKAFGFLNNLEYLGLGSREAIQLQKNDLKDISRNQLQEVSIGLKYLSEYELGTLLVLRTTKLHIVLPSAGTAALLNKVLHDAFTSADTLKLSNIDCSQTCDNYINVFKALGNVRISTLLLEDLTLSWLQFTSIIVPIWDTRIKNLSIINATLNSIRSSVIQHSDRVLETLIFRRIRSSAFYFNPPVYYDFFIKLKVVNLTISNSGMKFIACPEQGNHFKFIDLTDNSITSDFFFQDCKSLNLLETLILQQNELHQFYKLSTMTRYMKSLKNLDASQNQLTLDEKTNCLWTNSLKKLNLSSNRLTDLIFTCLPSNLEVLDVEKNNIYIVPQGVNNLEMLRELYLGSNKLVRLPECSNFRNLEILYVEGNSYQEPSSNFLQSCSRLTKLNAASNPFECTCDLRDFSRIKENTQVELVGWPESYQCIYPVNLRGTLLKDFYLSEVMCNPVLLMLIILGSMVVLAVVMGLTCHFLDLPWYLRMIYQWTQVKRRVMKTDRQQLHENCVYDAFVSYSDQDSGWVKEQLLPNLEERENPFRICLHERHFIPGKGIIQNIISCIEKSYKSIFILSPNFVQSEWCHYELYFAQHRVLSEQSNNLILVVLEPIPQYMIPSKYYKLKSLMAKKTYLEWPVDKSKQRLFWSTLQAAIGINITTETEETLL